jgi:hypothetical protein
MSYEIQLLQSRIDSRPLIDTYALLLSHHVFYTVSKVYLGIIFLIGIVGGGVQLDPLCTAVTNRTIVPAPGDYDDGKLVK